MTNQLSKEELITLVERIVAIDGTEEEVDRMIDLLERNVPDPEVTDLIFHSNPELSPVEVVERALAYRPLQL